MAYSVSKVLLFGVIGLLLATSIILTMQFLPILDNPFVDDPKIPDIPDIPVVQAGGVLIINVKDAPTDDLQEIFLQIDQVLVHGKGDGNETWKEITVMETDPFDLLLLEDTSLILAVGELPVGNYTEIRLHVVNANATINGESDIPLRVVANGWLKVKVHFTITDAPVTSVTIDIDVSSKPVMNKILNKNDPMLHPVVKAEVDYILIPDTPTLEQNYYLWAANDTINTPAPFTTENTSIDDVALTEAVLRLRLSIRNIGSAAWSAVELKVQYSTNLVQWDDVGTGAWLYADGLGTDGAQVGSLLLPGSSVMEHFVESAPTATIVDLPIAGQGEWDICLESNGAIQEKTYSFRFVLSDGTPLDAYSEYPTLTTVS
ncbi:MAG: DUF4382 domain-containing protein [Candidatus Thorarchaeota archaeon]|jgi:hypothetical protein